MAVKKQVTQVSKISLKWRLAAIFALLVATLLIVAPSYANKGIDWVNKKTNLGLPDLPSKGFNLGLDLQGGAHLIYQANTAVIPADKDKTSAVEGVRDVIERRVRGGLGVAEPLVQTTKVGDDYRIIVDLPGVTDVNQAIKMIGETPILQFKEQNTDGQRQLTADEKKQLSDFNAAAQKKAQQALVDLRRISFEQAVTKYSEDASSTKNNKGNLGFIDSANYPELFNWAKTHKDGEVSKTIIKSLDGLNIAKRISSKDGEKEVTASHILICYKDAPQCTSADTKEQALAKIQELKKQTTPQNFADLAKNNSTDTGSGANGGDLGTFKYEDMVPEFAKVAFEIPVGTISQPVETEFGYHLIYKRSENTPKIYEIARIFIKTKTEADILPPNSEWKDTGLSGKQLKRADVSQDPQTSQVQVGLQFNDEGTKLFADITKRNVGKPVAILLDNEPISIPNVNEPILNGSAVISGSFTLQEAKLLAQRLNSGALPVPVELISQQKVDATLGSVSLDKSFQAGIIGLLAVLAFMIIYYRLPGFLAAIALGVYTLLSLAIFKIIGVTLTLSGIAGFILSVGMAVDANVLIFERLKEELRAGKSLKSGMEEAFVRAWPSIRDSNITTLLSCVFLIWMGTGFVQGFAVVLAIGVLASMFSAIIITRTMLRFVAPWFKEEGGKLFLGYKKPETMIDSKQQNS